LSVSSDAAGIGIECFTLRARDQAFCRSKR
jgi:hypothetical protein